MTFEQVCDLITLICGIIPTIVAVVVLIKNIIQNKNWSLVEKIILEAMAAAEEYAKEHPEMTGEEKLDFALVAIKSGAQAAGITIDEKLLKKIIAYIEKMCTWSKKVTCDKCRSNNNTILPLSRGGGNIFEKFPGISMEEKCLHAYINNKWKSFEKFFQEDTICASAVLN